MYLIREQSYNSDQPVYMKLPEDNEYMFIPEARVAKDYFNTGFYEREYIDYVINNYISEEQNVIDIGAHIGMYTVSFSKKCNHVFSFECSPKSFNYLCANIALNKLDYKVTKFNCALSNVIGSTPYYIRDPNDGGGNGISKFECDNINDTPHITVSTNTLDSYNLTNIGFIKIDVEGHEKEVLEGSIETIKRNNYPRSI